jgi:hypothetical protein
MKINDLIASFEIFTTNEERSVLECLNTPMPLDSFTERQQIVIDNLLRKSLISKVKHGGAVLVIKNDR